MVVVERSTFSDDRGFFAETYRAAPFASFGLPQAFRQDAHSRSGQGVLRGLHYQRSPMAQGKLVWVATGRILDVAVDLRRSAATFGRWVSLELAADNRLGLYIPPGFAHGFYTLRSIPLLTKGASCGTIQTSGSCGRSPTPPSRHVTRPFRDCGTQTQPSNHTTVTVGIGTMNRE